MNKEATPYLAELLGTFGFVFIGAGSVVLNQASGDALGIQGIAFAHGMALLAFIYAFNHISGSHLNPAITVAMWIAKKVETSVALGYIVSQLSGAVFAAIFIEGLFGSTAKAIPTPTSIDAFSTVLLEGILTFFLTLVVFGILVDKRSHTSHAGLAIGFLFSGMVLVGFGLTGGAFNPARAFGPALVSNSWSNQWIYWVGPVVGAAIAAIVYEYGVLRKA